MIWWFFYWSVNFSFGSQRDKHLNTAHILLTLMFTLTSGISVRCWTNSTCPYSTAIARSSSFSKNVPYLTARFHRIKASTMLTMFHLTAEQWTFAQCSPFCQQSSVQSFFTKNSSMGVPSFASPNAFSSRVFSAKWTILPPPKEYRAQGTQRHIPTPCHIPELS